MKLPPRDIDRFLTQPGPDFIAALIYGPDPGLVRERSKKLASSLLGEGDAFGLTELAESDLRKDPAKLADELGAISMLGDKSVVVVRDAGEATGDILKDILKAIDQKSIIPEAFLIIEARELPPRSRLRKLAEKEKHIGVIACYGDDQRDLQPVISETFSAAGLGVEPEAMALLLERLGADRALTRNELEKIATYKGAGTASFTGGVVTSEDVEVLLGLSDEIGLDRLIDAAMLGQMDKLDRDLASGYQRDLSTAVIIRALLNHIERLYSVKSATQSGQSERDAMKSLRPPVFYKREDAFRNQLRRWNVPTLQQALHLALKSEVDTRQTGAATKAICAQTLYAIGSRARRLAR